MPAPASDLYNTDFERAIARNKRNTVLLFAILLAIGAVVGYVLGWGYAILDAIWSMSDAAVRRLSVGMVLLDLFGPPRPQAVAVAALVAGSGLIWGVLMLFAGARLLAAFAGARPAKANDPVERQLIDVIAEM